MNKHSKFNVFFKKNSPTILTIIGSVGVGITAVMSARDTVKAIKLIDEKQANTKKEKLKIAAPCYVPTVITGLSTILCIFGANKLNKKTQESLAAAYALLNQTYTEYRDSVKDIYGVDGNKKVVAHVAEKRIEENGLENQPDTDVFFDFFSLQFFKAKLSTILEVEHAANEMLQMHGYVSLGTLYSFMGADIQECDESLGWSLGAGKLYGYDTIQFDISEMPREDGSRYYVLDFVDAPTEDYLDL